MSIIVRGMEMPERCLDCPMYDRYNYNCQLYSFDISVRYNRDGSIRPEWCKLVELPEKHGRLIDGDVLWDAMSKYNDNEGAKMPFGYDDTSIHIDSACFVIENAPTVIEAEGEE